MARIRTVKPELFLHDDLFDAEQESGLPLRLAFIGLFTQVDRQGRFAWRPRPLGAQILPYDGVEFSRVLDALATRGFIRRYTSDGQEYGVIPSFTRHQAINNRERESELPPPPDDDATHGTAEPSTQAARVDDASSTHEGSAQVEGKGKEHGREGKGTSRGRSTFDASLVSLPEALNTPAFRKTWAEWCDARRERGKPISERAAHQQLQKLAELGPERAADAITKSIANDWQGIFPEQVGRNGQQNGFTGEGLAAFASRRIDG